MFFQSKIKKSEINEKTKTPCDQSGVEVFPPKKLPLGLKIHKLSKKAVEYLANKEQEGLRHCPKTCQQKNTYKTFITIAPAAVIPNSCPWPESNEVYSFKKTFTTRKSLNSTKQQVREQLEEQMTDWILNTFVYSYVPGKKFTPTKEFHSKKIGKACPKCSFYFDYNYFYTNENQIKLDIIVKCGDRKKRIQFARIAQVQIKNYWECLEKSEIP